MAFPSNYWPAWYYGPAGEAEIFQSEEDVPPGWLTNPAFHTAPELPVFKKSKSKIELKERT